MTITVERMVAVLEARLDKFEKGVERARKQAVGDFSAIESAGTKMEETLSGLAANSNRAFAAGAKGAQQFQRAMSSTRAETGNLAAQLNDIGVQLAGGQSPFLIALQQGSQINQILGQGGARGAVGALGGAFASLVNPVSLATIAIITLGGEAFQYFSTLLSEGEKSEEELRRQADLIRSLAKEWGDTVPAIREYADEIERAQKLSDLREGVQIINAETLDETKTAVTDTALAISDLVSQLQTAGEETEIITGLQLAFNEFSSAASDGSLKLEDVRRVQDALAAALNSSGIPAVNSFRQMFDQLSQSALAAAGSVQKLNAQTGGATTALYPSQGAYPGVDRAADGNVQNGGFTLPELGPSPDRRPLIELEGLPTSGRKGGRSKAISEAERERKAVVDLIEQLEFEQSQIGMTEVERAESNALRRAGAAATDEQKARISELVEATYAERDALKASQEAMKELQDIGRDVLQGIVSDLREGKKGADILAGALGRIADRLLDSALSGLFGGKGVAGGKGGLFGGAIIPGILHSGGIAGRDGYGHGRSVSPAVFSGAARYHSGGVAGLKPGEVPAILQEGEVIIPRGGKSSPAAASFTIDARTSIQASGNAVTDAELKRWAAKRDAEMPAQVRKIVSDINLRRG